MKKKNKVLSDKELIEKYEKGEQDITDHVEKVLDTKPNKGKKKTENKGTNKK